MPLRRITARLRLVARLRWHQAVQRITALLRRRVRWAAEGLALQEPRLQDLVQGLVRRGGVLSRPQAKAAKAKAAKAKPRR